MEGPVPFRTVAISSPAQQERDLTPQENGDAPGLKVAHTLTACCRCRARKTRCDPGLPRCSPCERSNLVCEYHDTSKGKIIPRTYVIYLQAKVQALEAELAQMSESQHISPDAECMLRNAGFVRFKENDASRYLGPSSGITMTRLVMDLAKQNTDTKSIKEIVPETKARQIKDRFIQEEEKPTSKVYPLISDVAAPHLPSRELANNLIDNFYRKAQYMLPTLHEPSYNKVVDSVYYGSTNAYENFTLRIVIAISMQKLDTTYAGLADSYYLAALPFLEDAIKTKDLKTLQCYALIAQYSLVTPTRTAAFWVVGLAARLCQELGITEEATIAPSYDNKPRFNALEVDMRRRLFWIIMSMEFGLAHSLGRPSSFGTTFDHIDVEFFKDVDDQYITPSGVMPGSPSSIKKRIAIHFFKMRLLQAEIRRKLYLRKKPEPKSDRDPWFQEMHAKLIGWYHSSLKDDEGSGLSEEWCEGRYNTMIVFLYRPTPQVPRPSANAARLCFEASIFNIYMQKKQIDMKLVDLTWIFTQSLFMALNAILWALSYPEIRKEYARDKVEQHIHMAQVAISQASERWPGVESALELYDHLIRACLKAYEGNCDTSYVRDPTSDKTSPASLQGAVTPPAPPSPFSLGLPGSSPRQDYKAPRLSPAGHNLGYDQRRKPRLSPTSSDFSLSDSGLSSSFQNLVTQQAFPLANPYQHASFNPASLYNSFPPASSSNQPNSVMQHDYGQYLGSIGEQYSQYIHAPYIPQQPLQMLNQQQQMELMRILENDGLGTG